MALGQGVLSKAAAKIETGSYGTPIALDGSGEENQIHIISENLSPAIEQNTTIYLDGSAAQKGLFRTLKKYNGDLAVEMHYGGCVPLLICALGLSHRDNSPINKGSGAYQHWIEPCNDLSTRSFNGFEQTDPANTLIRRLTIGIEKDVSIWEATSAMVDKWTIEAEPGRVQLTLGMIVRKIEHDSATNNTSTNWALPSESQLLFNDMTVYIRARDTFYFTANRTLILNESSNVTLTIPSGTYTGYQLAEKIAALANADTTLTGSYSCSYNDDDRRFTIKSTVSFFVDSAGTANIYLGFPTSADSVAGLEVTSIEDARPNKALTDLGTNDKVGVSKITISGENNLDDSSQDTESDLYLLEPERNDFRRITGTIEIPRYENDIFLNAVHGSTIYEMKIEFTGNVIGGSHNEEFNIYIPQLKFTSATAPATGAPLIKQTLSFEVISPTLFTDLKNFYHGEYFWRKCPENDDSSNCLCVGVGRKGLYVGLNNWKLAKWSEDPNEAWEIYGSSGTQPMSLKHYKDKLYIGGADGKIVEFNYDTESFSISTDVGTGKIMDFEIYNGNLYAVEEDTGKVFEFNGTAWSLSTDTVGTDADNLVAYNGNLYMCSDDVVYVFNGTTWSMSTDFGNTPTTMSMVVHRGKLYVTSSGGTGDARLYSYDGTAWVEESGALEMATVRHITSYRGNLLLFPDGDGDIWVWAYDAAEDGVNVYSAFNSLLTPYSKPVEYAGALIVCKTDIDLASLHFYTPLPELYMTVQNTRSTNPL